MKKSKVAGVLLMALLAFTALPLQGHAAEAQPAQVSQPAQLKQQAPAPRMRRPKMSKERAVNILNENYGFEKKTLEELFDAKPDYRELDRLCLYSYLSKKPLLQVVKMRELYTWERLKLALGLTPQKFYDRKIEYQADRLYTRMNIDRRVTIKYMKQGFPMHHINMAALLVPKCNKSIYDIMLMKTPKNTWNDVALQLGLTIQDCQEVKDIITKGFKR